MKTFLFVCVISYAYVLSSSATEIIVTPEGTYGYSTIQSAIDTVPPRDFTRIIVYPGVYEENLVVTTGQFIHITSTNPPCAVTQAATVVDGTFSGTVLTVLGPTTLGQLVTTCRVEGVTLRNGLTSGSGGGIFGQRSWDRPYMYVEVIHCVISNCVAQGTVNVAGGGGIAYVRGKIISNIITACSVTGIGAGGIHYVDADIMYNLIYNNHGQHGGGVSMSANASGRIMHNIISNNVSRLDGGGIRRCYSDVAFNIITHNYAEQNGGGVFRAADNHVYNNIVRYNVANNNGGGFGDSSFARNFNTFMNNLVYSNVASNYGGGFANYTMSYHVHNTVVKNIGLNGGGGYYECGESVIVNSIIASNFPNNVEEMETTFFEYSCVPGDAPLSATCITQDPLFVSYANNDFRLTSVSPCRDAGADGYNLLYAYVADMDGRLRQYGAAPDMGAYEYGAPPDSDGDMLSDEEEAFYGTDPYAWDTSGDGYADGLLVRRGQSPLMPLTTMTFRVEAGEKIQPVFGSVVMGDSVVLGAGTHRGEFLLSRPGLTLRGERDENENLLTLIDGEGVRPGLVYLLEPADRLSRDESIIDGLILSNGFGIHGGGITFIRAHDTRIRECLFIHNRGAFGGGIARVHTTHSGTLLEISRCSFIENTALLVGGAAANIEVSFFGLRPWSESVFLGNTAEEGGALYGVQAIIERCVFENNSASGYGGAISRPAGEIRSSLFVGNTAQEGGAVYDNVMTTADNLYNNTFVHNSATEVGGAVLYEPMHHHGAIINCIFWSNAAPEGSQVYPTSGFTGLFANVIMDDAFDYNENTNAMPQFMDWSAGDYRLSPDDTIALDNGMAYSEELMYQLDLAGNPRLVAPQIDRGCYEQEGRPFDFSLTGRFFVVFHENTGNVVEQFPRHIRRGVMEPPAAASSSRNARRVGLPEGTVLSDHCLPWPYYLAGDYMRSGAITGDGTMCMAFGPVYPPVYMEPDSMQWMSLYYKIGMAAYTVHTLAARDTVGTGEINAFLTAGTVSSTDPQLNVIAYPELVTAVLPHAGFVSATVGLPDDYGVIFGSQPDGSAFAYGIEVGAGALVTATLSAPPNNLAHGVAPTYNEAYGDVWYVNNEENTIVGHDLTFGISRATIPLPTTGNNWTLGSHPDGIVLADKETFTLYTYTVTATLPGRSSGYMTPVQGFWQATPVNAPIIGLSIASSQIVIPEPVAACVLYFLGGFLALVLVRRRA